MATKPNNDIGFSRGAKPSSLGSVDQFILNNIFLTKKHKKQHPLVLQYRSQYKYFMSTV
jgi:hypothetical protein